VSLPRATGGARARELALLRESWQAARGGRSLLILIEGQAGIGKSWLVRAFRAGLEAAPYVASTPFVSVALRASAHLLAAEREAAFLAAARQVAPGGPWAPVPGENGWAPDREGVRIAIAGAFARVARARGGLCLVVEDVHAWSEDDRADLRAFWRYWASAETPVLVVVTARPLEAGTEAALWFEDLRNDAFRAGVSLPGRLELWPLAAAEMSDLIRAVLAGGQPPEGLAEWLQERSGGHPLHAQELLRFLVEGGALIGIGGVWTFQPPSAEAVPGDLDSILRRRLARAREDPELWSALVALGALDRSVELNSWSKIAEVDPEGLAELAAYAIELGLVGLELRQGQSTYALAHPLYPALVRALSDRAQLKAMHLRIAQVARFPGERARHGRMAGHPDAAEWTEEAIVDARARFAHAEVAAHASALAASGGGSEELLITWAEAMFQLGRLEEALEVLSASRSAGGLHLRVKVWKRKLSTSEALAALTSAIAEHPGDHRLRLELAGLLIDGGRLAEAERELRALDRARPANDAERAGVLLGRSRLLRAKGDWPSALTEARSAARRLRRLPAEQQALLPAALQVLGEIALVAGRLDQAAEALGESIALAEARGERSELPRRHLDLGLTRLNLGQRAKAEASLSQALQLAASLGDLAVVSQAREALEGLGPVARTQPGETLEAPAVYLRTLGEFGLHKGERGVRWRARKVRELLALLVIAGLREAGPAIPRERIIDTLWPDSSPERAEGVFRAALKRLRAALAGAAEVAREASGAYFLSDLRADVIFFQEALDRGDQAAAAAWYQGEFLPGIDLPGVEVIRERLRSRFRRVAHDLAASSPASKAGYLYERLLDDDPFDLDALTGLARTLSERGEKGRLVRRLRAAASRARAELGEVPEELTALLRTAGLES